jgi:hypothetical protein
VNDCQMAGGLLAQLLQVPQAQLILLQVHSEGNGALHRGPYSTEPLVQYSESNS